MSSDLLILNAEEYVGAADLRSNEKAEKVKKSSAAHSEEGPRKRAKTSSKTIVSELEEENEDEEDADADEKSKRARGRPRLDTRDQNAVDVGSSPFIWRFTLPPNPLPTTFFLSMYCVPAIQPQQQPLHNRIFTCSSPAIAPKLWLLKRPTSFLSRSDGLSPPPEANFSQRRRTQIRLAQRAYRSRKENSIQTLENEVRVLQETKAEMSNVFMKLHDFAVSQGLLEKAPAFAQELQATTEQITLLANKPSESGGENSSATRTGKDSVPKKKSTRKQPESSSSRKAVEAPPTDMGSSVWGYNFDHETQIHPAVDMPDVSHPAAGQMTIAQAPLGYEIITSPTPDNASFPFDPNTRGSFFAQGTIRSNQDQNVTPNITPPAFSPSDSLPMPPSVAFVEATFGRRLQRSTIELACRLSTMPNPPNDKFAKVFGFCLLFEPIEQIRTRLHKALEKSRQESLNNWRVPFWALGGIGQHQVGGQQQNKFVGNQGTVDVAKHGFGTNFAVGPFDATTTEARDRQLDANMRIMLPGFQGDFFDPDEVELYLQSRGVCIQPGQDYVTAEVDMAWLEDLQQQQHSNDLYTQWVAGMPPTTSKPPATMATAATDGTWMDGRLLADTQSTTVSSGLRNDTRSVLASQKQIVTLNVEVLIRGEFDFVSSFLQPGILSNKVSRTYE